MRGAIVYSVTIFQIIQYIKTDTVSVWVLVYFCVERASLDSLKLVNFSGFVPFHMWKSKCRKSSPGFPGHMTGTVGREMSVHSNTVL